ncbi:hypothetical protein O6H91_15G030100 [Diphasiastrum complanatum]|uniref:Uncharacterized protein n=1 Tax=Diphasiastrum complanatum TaxID=34168 RepID=A0ACC2BGX2_DIPCM|nr:hypothetical protein O6H91_15G030100 [Diphasiastrum complanatum]
MGSYYVDFPQKDEKTQQEAELKAATSLGISIDLVRAARRQLSFLRAINSLPFLYSGPAVDRAIYRYWHFWMPLAADKTLCLEDQNASWSDQAFLPPVDVQWVWHCHCLRPRAYRNFCLSHFQRVIDLPFLHDPSNEAAARERCKQLWSERYPEEPYNILSNLSELSELKECASQKTTADLYPEKELHELVSAIARQSSFYTKICQPHVWKETFLYAALERYKCFLYILLKSKSQVFCVPTYDIDLMWHSHQLSPIAYAKDTRAILGWTLDHDDLLDPGPETKLEQGFKDTKKLWENIFGFPYERAGIFYRASSSGSNLPKAKFQELSIIMSWDEYPKDINTKLVSLHPRHMIEVCISGRNTRAVAAVEENLDLFVRLSTLDSHKSLKLDRFMPCGADSPWQRLYLLQCEICTKGVTLELRRPVKSWVKSLGSSKLIGDCELSWKEMQKASMLVVEKPFKFNSKKEFMEGLSGLQLHLAASITPPVQAPYLLKIVPDRVTDDSGAMLSNIILRMNKYHPQQGRWITRTVLNHHGAECFVIRIRIAKGIWRHSGDRPVGVDWSERVVHICEGGWTYVSGSIGIAPADNIIASATPNADELDNYKLTWSFSSSETFSISRDIDDPEWERHVTLELKNTLGGPVSLVNGRKLQYEVPDAKSEDEEGFVTLIRYTTYAPLGSATALFNWKISAIEVEPQEDVLLVLLLCIATLRTIADLGGGKNYGNLFVRKRLQESLPGLRDWESVFVHEPVSEDYPTHWYMKPSQLYGSATVEAPIVRVKGMTTTQLAACGASCGAGEWGGSTALSNN